MSEAQLLIYLTSCMALAYTSSDLCFCNELTKAHSLHVSCGPLQMRLMRAGTIRDLPDPVAYYMKGVWKQTMQLKKMDGLVYNN
jgi:hypothetical protein